jgi:hypothetical protein
MKKIVLLLLACVCMFAGCSQAPDRLNDRLKNLHQHNDHNLFNINNLSKEQEGLIRNNTADYVELSQNIDKAAVISADQNNQCILVYKTKSYIDCLSIFRSVNKESAKIEVITAKYFAQNGKKEKAKEMYLKIIKTYIGNAYRSYVNQAESGLKDLKEK